MSQPNLQAMTLRQLKALLASQQERREDLNRKWDVADGKPDAARWNLSRIEVSMSDVDALIGSIEAEIKTREKQARGEPMARQLFFDW